MHITLNNLAASEKATCTLFFIVYFNSKYLTYNFLFLTERKNRKLMTLKTTSKKLLR